MICNVSKLAKEILYSGSALLGVALLCILASTGGCFAERWQFTKLQGISEDTAKAEPLAVNLRNTQRGVHLALSDMNCYGGKTRGWSSWILETSPLSSLVESGLKRVVNDASQGLSRQVEATIILWRRTGDPSWLVLCYQLVQKSGGSTVAMGRKRLTGSADFGDLRARIDVPATQDARASTNEVLEFIRTNKVAVTSDEAPSFSR